jgi:hypothetical protein
MKLEAPSCQRIERSAVAPVKREEPAGVRSRYLDLVHNEVDAPLTEAIGDGTLIAPPPQITTPHDLSVDSIEAPPA